MSSRSGLGVGAKESVDPPSLSLSATSHLLELLGCRRVEAGAQELAKEPAIDETRLTPRKVNRKRPGDDGAETPSSNKRRNVGPPGSTPFAHRMTPLSRRITYNAAPYSERLRRRTIENQGRIHKTVFRLPQLLAQNEADRRAAESSPVKPCTEPLQMNAESTEKQSKSDDQDASDVSATVEPPSTPPARGWNIRGLINSVPRSFSRLLPRFGRSQTSEAPGTFSRPIDFLLFVGDSVCLAHQTQHHRQRHSCLQSRLCSHCRKSLQFHPPSRCQSVLLRPRLSIRIRMLPRVTNAFAVA